VPHAFGGALALAWCTARPRATIGIDLNLFVGPDEADQVLDALPEGVEVDEAARREAARKGQARLRWGVTPIDVFFSTTLFHQEAAARVRRQPFGGMQVPFLACRDLAVFKAFFNRPQDWADLQNMAEAEAFDAAAAADDLARYLGAGDPRVERLRRLRPMAGGGAAAVFAARRPGSGGLESRNDKKIPPDPAQGY